MEMYIKETRENYLEVIDLEYPQYLFVLDGLDFKEVGGKLEIVVENLSVKKSIKKEGPNPIPDEEEDAFLESHGQKIIKEIFDSFSKTYRL